MLSALDADHVAALDAELGCKCATQMRGISPRERGDGIGKLLQPRVVRKASVVRARVTGKFDLDGVSLRSRRVDRRLL